LPYGHEVELCIRAGKTGTPRRQAQVMGTTVATVTIHPQVWGQHDAASRWFPIHVAQPPAGCRMLFYGLHFTFTSPHCHNKDLY